MSDVPFLYGEELETILGSVRTLRKILVFGGPAMGKTTLIEEVLARSPGAELVRGRGGDEEIVRRIVTWAQDPARRGRDLLIDNLDHIFSEDVERALRDLPDSDGLGRMIATSGTPTKWLEKQGAPPPDPSRGGLNLLVHDSTALNAFHPLWLDPWPSGWERTIPLRVRGALSRQAAKFDGALVELEERSSRGAFADLLVDLSDGHPALLGAAFRSLVQRLERHAWRREHGDLLDDDGAGTTGPLEPEALREPMLEELAESQLEVVGRAVDWVEAQSTAAAAELLEMAAGDEEREVVAERTLLSKAGLLHRSSSGAWRVPGGVIGGCILRRHERMPDPVTTPPAASAPGRPAPIGPLPIGVDLEPDRRVPDMQGQVVWAADAQRQELGLSGASWRILQTLADAGGALVTVPEIRERIEQDSDKAVRSALQRLQGELRGHGLDGLVVNVRRKGYLFDPDFEPGE